MAPKSVILLITGDIKLGDGKPFKFSEVFHLVPNPAGGGAPIIHNEFMRTSDANPINAPKGEDGDVMKFVRQYFNIFDKERPKVMGLYVSRSRTFSFLPPPDVCLGLVTD